MGYSGAQWGKHREWCWSGTSFFVVKIILQSIAAALTVWLMQLHAYGQTGRAADGAGALLQLQLKQLQLIGAADFIMKDFN